MSDAESLRPMAAHVPIERLLECVHCGLCLPACPTYLELGNEADSPRGRIHLIRDLVDGRLNLNAEAVRHLDFCLGCLGCETACPSGVRYREIIEGARAVVQQTHRRSWWERLQRRLVLEVFPQPARLATLLWPVRLADWLGLGPLIRRIPPADLLPPLNDSFRRELPEVIPPRGARRYRVALFRGCVTRVLFPQVEDALVRILTENGCEVTVPPRQGCCGALAAHEGDRGRAVQFIRAVVQSFTNEVDAVVVTAAGCSAFLRSYGYWSKGTPWENVSREFAARVRDASEFLLALDLPPPPGPLGRKVAYHHACHLAHAQGIREQPIRILELAGVKLVRLEEDDVCCGAAGSYVLLERKVAKRLGDRKARHIVASGAEVVAVANPGCSLHIRASLRRLRAFTIAVTHPIELLAAAYGDAR